MFSGRSIATERRRWGRKERAVEVESAALAPADALHGPYDRFAAPSLSPIEGNRRGGWNKARAKSSTVLREATIKARAAGPLKAADKVLLMVELAGALVVAWLVWQYVYTVYFDTTPHKIPVQVKGTPGRAAERGNAPTSPTIVATRAAPKPTPTPFVELAPPLVAGAGGDTPLPSNTPVPTLTPTATSTIEPGMLLPTRLRIPAMVLDSPIEEVKVNLGQWEVSPMLIGHHEGSANPGEVGNVVLAGHRDINSALFRDLDRLKPGDEVFVSNSLREYRYIVKESFVVQPTQVEVMAPTDDKRVTLITCTPIGLATQRLIVVAMLDEGY